MPGGEVRSSSDSQSILLDLLELVVADVQPRQPVLVQVLQQWLLSGIK